MQRGLVRVDGRTTSLGERIPDDEALSLRYYFLEVAEVLRRGVDDEEVGRSRSGPGRAIPVVDFVEEAVLRHFVYIAQRVQVPKISLESAPISRGVGGELLRRWKRQLRTADEASGQRVQVPRLSCWDLRCVELYSTPDELSKVRSRLYRHLRE